MNILPQADNKKYIEEIHLAPSANLVCRLLGLSQALLIASFWFFHNQCDLAINMIKVILVKSLILKSIDLLPDSRARFGLISTSDIFKSRNTNISTPTSSFSRYLGGCDGGAAAAGKCWLWIWEMPQILPSHHLLLPPHCPSKAQPTCRHFQGLTADNCSGK